MAPIDPMPLKLLNNLPPLLITFPGASSVPANNEPIITASAPAARAFAISPENFIPPSAIMLTFLLLTPFLTLRIALSCGTPIPATNLVVQIEPGPIPTFIISTPNLIRNFAASSVATFPAQRETDFGLIFLIFLIISPTFFVWPWAVSTTIKSILHFRISLALSNSLVPAPTAAPTFNPKDFTFFISITCFFTDKFLCITPIPPAFAIAIAIFASVTVSIAEVINGILSCKLLVSDVSVCTSDGKTEEYFGASVTSSNVSASFIGPMSLYIRFYIN